jgi:hypothetical protein
MIPYSIFAQSVMRRRLTGRGFGLLILCLATGAFVWAGPFHSGRWTKIPSITVVAAAGDPRVETVREAVAYWNRTFAELGTPFRLGDINVVTGGVPDGDIQSLADQVLHGSSSPSIPESLRRLPGDLVVVLSDARFVSYTAYRGGRVFVAIKNGNTPPLALPNVLRNVIAHELGHAIDLEHNADPALLMCGRPAACRPDAFQSATPRFFPLSDSERKYLLILYPRNWTAQK